MSKKAPKPSLMLLCQPVRGRIFRLSPTEGRAWLFDWKRCGSNPWEELDLDRFVALAQESPIASMFPKEASHEHHASEA